MAKPDNPGVARLSRREEIGRVARAEFGIASVLTGGGEPASLSAQAGLPAVIPPAPDEIYLKPPCWKTELRQLAPNVYAYGRVAVRVSLVPVSPTPAAGGKLFGCLINTHHHGDHVSGNQFFLPADILRRRLKSKP
jgi:hypothetical protein